MLLGMMLLHVPEVQSMPDLLGTQNWPDACFSRQQPGLTIMFRWRQYWVLEQPLESLVHCVHRKRVLPKGTTRPGTTLPMLERTAKFLLLCMEHCYYCNPNVYYLVTQSNKTLKQIARHVPSWTKRLARFWISLCCPTASHCLPHCNFQKNWQKISQLHTSLKV